MNKTKFIFILTFLFTISLALAVTVETDKNIYQRSEEVTIDVAECEAESIVFVYNAENREVDVSSDTGDWTFIYSTLSDPSDGKYNVEVSCANGPATTEFCVNDDDCLTTTPEDPDPTPDNPGGGGGRNVCRPVWTNLTETLCNGSLQKTVTQQDVRCSKGSRKIVSRCDSCKESWMCSVWSLCNNGIQTRICYDGSKCGTTFQRPDLRKNCGQPASGYPPSQISNSIPPPTETPTLQLPTEPFWEKYLIYLISIPAGLIVLILIIVLIVHMIKSKRVVYNLEELEDWIMKERAAGTNDGSIREILKDNTSWNDKEIDEAFNDLAKE
jgi:hypothetical protein